MKDGVKTYNAIKYKYMFTIITKIIKVVAKLVQPS